MMTPIKPSDIPAAKLAAFPDGVIEAFNELILQSYSDGFARISQNSIIERMLKKGLDRSDISVKGWLNVEEIYRQAGWTVVYDKPGFNEAGDAYFEFAINPRIK